MRSNDLRCHQDYTRHWACVSAAMDQSRWHCRLPPSCNNSFMMNSRTLQHAVVILAAGASSRLGKPKQLVQLNGESLINHTVRVALETIPAQTLLVLGHDADVIYSTIKYQPVERIDCADWQQGMS